MADNTRHFTLSLAALACSIIMFAQEKQPTPKDIAEKSAAADHVYAQEIRKKQLKAAPVKLTPPDTLHPSPQSIPSKKKKKTKSR